MAENKSTTCGCQRSAVVYLKEDKCLSRKRRVIRKNTFELSLLIVWVSEILRVSSQYLLS